MKKSKLIWLYVMAALYIVAGVNHFIHPSIYISIIPPWLPQKLLLNNVAGAFELLFGFLLIPKFTSRYAAAGIILLLIAVYPANIQMAINYYRTNDPFFWVTIVRLPIQVLLIWWAWKYAKRNRRTS